MFGHMYNLTVKLFFRSNDFHNVCFVSQICSYRQQSEQIGKQTFSAVNMSPICGICSLRVGNEVGDTSTASIVRAYLSYKTNVRDIIGLKKSFKCQVGHMTEHQRHLCTLSRFKSNAMV